MQRTKCQYRRLLQVLDLIRQGREPQDNIPDLSTISGRGALANCRTIAKELAVSEKTVRRDISFLMDQLGVPIAYDDQRHGYYLTEPCFSLSGGVLKQDDLLSLLLAERLLVAHGHSVLAASLQAIVERIPAAALSNVEGFRKKAADRLQIRDGAESGLTAEMWSTLARAWREGRRVLVSLKPDNGAEGGCYRLDPHSLIHEDGRWLLTGTAYGKDGAIGTRTETLAAVDSLVLLATQHRHAAMEIVHDDPPPATAQPVVGASDVIETPPTAVAA